MENEELADRLGRLESQLRGTRLALAVAVVAGVVGAAWASSSLSDLHSVVSPGEQAVTVREVRLLFGDARDGEFREEPPTLTAQRLHLGDNRGDFVHIEADSTHPVRAWSSRGSFTVANGQGAEVRLTSGDARVELYAHESTGPHLGFLGPGGQMDMGTSFLSVLGPAGAVKLEGRDEGTLGLVVTEWSEGEPTQTLLPER